MGHPKIFINTDKPEIATCGYCGVPFVSFHPAGLELEVGDLGPGANRRQAHEHHREYLKSLPETSYPLEPTGDPAEVNEEQRVTPGAFEQR